MLNAISGTVQTSGGKWLSSLSHSRGGPLAFDSLTESCLDLLNHEGFGNCIIGLKMAALFFLDLADVA